MGTRADFYANENGEPRWIGSIAWDGHPDSLPVQVIKAASHDVFVAAVEQMFRTRDDVSRPEHGWPWPWEDSWTSDYAYTWHDGRTIWTIGSNETRGWTDKEVETDEEYDTYRVPSPFELPDMSALQRVTFGKRSGVLIITAGGAEPMGGEGQ